MLAATEKHDVDSFAKIQSDVTSLFVRELLPLMLKRIHKEENYKSIYKMMASWDSQSLPDRPEMLIFAYWYDEMVRGILDNEAAFLDQDSKGKMKKNRRHWIRSQLIKNILEDKDGQSAWCGNAAVDTKPVDCKPIVLASLKTALAKISAKYGADRSKWKWGEEHMAVSEHRPMGKFPVLNKLFNVRVPTGGGPYTVNVANYKKPRMGYEFPSVHAASLRHIFDLSDLNKSKFIYQAGQSGNPLSKYYDNFAKDWAAVRYLSLTTEKSVYEKDSIGTLILKPKS